VRPIAGLLLLLTAGAAQAQTAADRFYDPAAMAAARQTLRDENGGMTFALTRFNLAEIQIRRDGEALRWDGETSWGGDLDRLVVSSEGEARPGKRTDEAEAQLLWAHAITPYFNLEAGLRHDFAPRPTRNYATLAVTGTAPYWLEVEAALFVSERGTLSGRLKLDHDARLTQRLILQPRAELNLAADSDPTRRIGAGLTTAELGLRLRYEIDRRFAPYVGIDWQRAGGATARFVRASGEPASTTGLVLGIRGWF
jgi:copper resistance protein B